MECPELNIFIKGNELQQRDQLINLGRLISRDEQNKAEISLTIVQAKMTFQRMKPKKCLQINVSPCILEEPWSAILSPF